MNLKTKLKQIYALAAVVAPCSPVAAGLYPRALRRLRISNKIKPARRRPATAAIIIIIGNQLNPFLGGGGTSILSPAIASAV